MIQTVFWGKLTSKSKYSGTVELRHDHVGSVLSCGFAINRTNYLGAFDAVQIGFVGARGALIQGALYIPMSHIDEVIRALQFAAAGPLGRLALEQEVATTGVNDEI